ncbi:hypothetical protein NE236_22665 [Actinoallomurus purpureus]|uniref:hypothetical protein n=1 Tax=Actinoallomurus purpureus TaxID=478114 RepID=UPI00209389C1|nr:hypothetical protein [Actinoallomurus purpureus]MCO6007785.1 hypothetical protein [Actinoallomurus purpureus]
MERVATARRRCFAFAQTGGFLPGASRDPVGQRFAVPGGGHPPGVPVTTDAAHTRADTARCRPSAPQSATKPEGCPYDVVLIVLAGLLPAILLYGFVVLPVVLER